MTDPTVPTGARPSARVILLDPSDRLLLLHCRDEGNDHSWWVTPGGGLSGAESFEAAALREAREETGLDVQLGPCVWTRHHIYVWEGQRFDQYERFFVGRCGAHAVAPLKPGQLRDRVSMVDRGRDRNVGRRLRAESAR